MQVRVRIFIRPQVRGHGPRFTIYVDSHPGTYPSVNRRRAGRQMIAIGRKGRIPGVFVRHGKQAGAVGVRSVAKPQDAIQRGGASNTGPEGNRYLKQDQRKSYTQNQCDEQLFCFGNCRHPV